MVSPTNPSTTSVPGCTLPSESPSSAGEELPQTQALTEVLVLPNSPLKFSKQQIRSSLKASTWNGVFAAIFSSITADVLLSNFLLQLGATAMQIGMLSSVPMLVNLLQPVGAYISEKTSSRHWYGFWIYGISRLLWLVLPIAIWLSQDSDKDKHYLVLLTLGIVLASNLLGALGAASWLSWMAVLVPERLRGRYFGLRNRATNLVIVIGGPLLGVAVSAWPGGMLPAYSVMLILGVIVGLISIGFQFLMADVNPLREMRVHQDTSTGSVESPSPINSNFLRFLFYFGFWTFAANVSSPFFNIYLLDDLDINVGWVTLYKSLAAGSNLLMLVVWGKLADRIGNRPILLLAGILVALTPALWLGTGYNAVSVWVWLPLLHLLTGGSWAAMDLCNNNIQISLAPTRNQATYFGYAAAVSGVGGALGATLGGFLAEQANFGGIPGLFALSTVVRLMALIPLVFVSEQRSKSLSDVLQQLRQIIPDFSGEVWNPDRGKEEEENVAILPISPIPFKFSLFPGKNAKKSQE